jgi:signal transduction histidine kinase
VVAYPSRIAQVLFNLVSNAVKFTPRGGRIEVRTSLRAGEVVVEVADTGLGLTPEQESRLFQPFSRVHAETHAARGTGLGLYITKGIVEQHGGRLWCHSDGPGLGTTFSFSLPAGAAPRRAMPPAAAEPVAVEEQAPAA